MKKLIAYETLRSFAYVNDAICRKPIRGIAIRFFGLGNMDMYDEDPEEGKFLAENGILYVVPYNNPWAWMNDQAAEYTDEILDVLMEKYGLPEDLPIVSTGGSMGGQSALVYMAKAKRTPVACVANCPVCDLPFHFTERPDLPRTLYSAFYHEAGDMEEVLRNASPLHMIDRLPQAEYYLFHCECDHLVNKEKHTDALVEAMQDKFRVTYHTVPGRDHCDLSEPMAKQYMQYICDAVQKRL